jgi:hypothetical protein
MSETVEYPRTQNFPCGCVILFKSKDLWEISTWCGASHIWDFQEAAEKEKKEALGIFTIDSSNVRDRLV